MKPSRPECPNQKPTLTPHEQIILKELYTSASIKQLAQKYNCAPNALSMHIHRLSIKLKVSGRMEIMARRIAELESAIALGNIYAPPG